MEISWFTAIFILPNFDIIKNLSNNSDTESDNERKHDYFLLKIFEWGWKAQISDLFGIYVIWKIEYLLTT